jgi:hypothetical protein
MIAPALSPALLTLFADLVQQVETAERGGSVYRRARGGSVYHYAKVPVGSVRVDTFIGQVGDPAADARAAALGAGMAQARARRAVVAMLRRGGLAGPDRMTGATLDAISHAGLFRAGAVVVGTVAYMLSEPHVGQRLPAPMRMTGDLDLATMDVALAADPPDSMQAILARADPGFAPVMQLDPRRPPSRFRSPQGYFVDLIVQRRRGGETNPVPLPALQAGAAPLQHLAWLIEHPVRTVALWGAGVPVAIPQPARFAVHKLMLAQRRGPADRIKRGKDLAQAASLIAALRRHDPFALEDALDDARARGRDGWRRPIDRSLAELGERADEP